MVYLLFVLLPEVLPPEVLPPIPKAPDSYRDGMGGKAQGEERHAASGVQHAAKDEETGRRGDKGMGG